METTSFLVNAIYDIKTGEILLAHPKDENVFVTQNHYNELISDKGENNAGTVFILSAPFVPSR